MKARVKTTGEIVEIIKIEDNLFIDSHYYQYEPSDIECEISDNDYWTRLEHQYVGMAMQGIVSSYEAMREISKERDIPQYVANMAFELAHALVEELKKKEERK